VIVYVESNFALEIARAQEAAPAAEEILRLAGNALVSLMAPTLAVFEPFSTLTYYGVRRNQFVEDLKNNLRELGRSLPHKSLAKLLEPLGPTLVQVSRDEMERLEKTTERMLGCVGQVPMTVSTFREATQAEKQFGLSPQDAMIYASIMTDLRSRPSADEKCFISQNRKDFGDPEIVRALATLNCKYLSSFGTALDFIRSRLGSA
jgi:hypothetical protein